MRKLIFILLLGLFTTTVANAQYPTDVEKSVSDFMRKAKAEKFVRKIQPQLHRVYINPVAWVYFNYDVKKGFTKICAKYVNMHIEQDAEIVKIYSYQSGEKLARYNSLLGFKVF